MCAYLKRHAKTENTDRRARFVEPPVRWSEIDFAFPREPKAPPRSVQRDVNLIELLASRLRYLPTLAVPTENRKLAYSPGEDGPNLPQLLPGIGLMPNVGRNVDSARAQASRVGCSLVKSHPLMPGLHEAIDANGVLPSLSCE